jgi:flavin reductase (DIM6/NTAB) family NADH-FMN oxidoreductase RutF
VKDNAMTIAVKPPLDLSEPTLRDAMRQVAGGVSVVTVGEGEDRTGLTVTSAVSLSIDPPTMIVCVNRSASSWPLFQRYGHFCVNVLAAHHQPVADRFAGRHGVKGARRYEGVRWERLATGAPALADAVAAIDCAIEEAIERHSHAILIGAVRALRIRGGEPLIYAAGRYGQFTAA